jgi:hypothetical protein|tara:strand:+ start:183 stop:389 length:207 start_codon:yes stop_codon:yes gene_type:complete
VNVGDLARVKDCPGAGMFATLLRFYPHDPDKIGEPGNYFVDSWKVYYADIFTYGVLWEGYLEVISECR